MSRSHQVDQSDDLQNRLNEIDSGHSQKNNTKNLRRTNTCIDKK